MQIDISIVTLWWIVCHSLIPILCTSYYCTCVLLYYSLHLYEGNLSTVLHSSNIPAFNLFNIVSMLELCILWTNISVWIWLIISPSKERSRSWSQLQNWYFTIRDELFVDSWSLKVQTEMLRLILYLNWIRLHFQKFG